MDIYLDNSATTKVRVEVLREMIPYFNEEYGNPSSIYCLGRRAKNAIENARKRVADLINAEKNEIYFTAGGSESDNIALKGIAYMLKNKGNHIITSKIEHPAILDSCKFLEEQGFEVTYLNVDDKGLVNLNELKSSITDKTILISIMFANNEIGTIEPIREISNIAKEKDILFHTDAVQALGNIEIDVKKLNIDLLSMSSHKIYGPKGIGALYVRKGVDFKKLINGGHQEKNKRAGTENVPGIVGFGKACSIARDNMEDHIEKIKDLRDYFFSEVKNKINDIKINGDIQNRLPGNANVSFNGANGLEILLELDKKGIAVSTGSACSSGSDKPSHVLTAIGLEKKYTSSAIRVSIGEFNKKWEIDYLLDNLVEIVKKIRD